MTRARDVTPAFLRNTAGNQNFCDPRLLTLSFPPQAIRQMRLKRRTTIAAFFVLWLVALSTDCFVRAEDSFRLQIGTCDWSIKMPLSRKSFEFAQSNHLEGIQYSFDVPGKGLDLRQKENRETIRQVVKETGVAISSLGIGLLNKVPLATTEEADQLVIECLETMVKLKQEAAGLEDRELAAKVSPRIVLLAFFNAGDINGKPELMEVVIEKLRRLAPVAEKHGLVLGLETLLNESDLRYIIKSVGSPAVKVYYDTGNSARMGYDIYREIESLGVENICEIHIKENKSLLGEGKIDFGKIKGLLKTIQYRGWLIIEGSKPSNRTREKAAEQNAGYAVKLFGS